MFAPSRVLLQPGKVIYPMFGNGKRPTYMAFLRQTLDLPENQAALVDTQRAHVEKAFEAELRKRVGLTEAEIRRCVGEVCRCALVKDIVGCVNSSNPD